MKEMTMQQTIEYLKQASILETSIYKQKEIKEQAKKMLVQPEVEKKELPEKPTYIERMQPLKPSLIEDLQSDCDLGLKVAACSAVAAIISLFINTGAALIAVGIFAAVLAGCLLKVLPAHLSYSRKYPYILEEYRQACEEGKQKYEQELQAYNEAVVSADEQYAAEVGAAWRAYQSATKEVAKLDGPISETQSLLTKLYGANVIFPKYRNMVAMCTMYEYFESGRCTELEGPNGAYNLYEAEQRQNVIISQLEAVNANLEQVKQNQYILYKGISETNYVLKGVSEDIKGILSMTKDIAVSSRITAFCAQVTAVNAQVQTYLAILD